MRFAKWSDCGIAGKLSDDAALAAMACDGCDGCDGSDFGLAGKLSDDAATFDGCDGMLPDTVLANRRMKFELIQSKRAFQFAAALAFCMHPR